ncbi:MAG: uroporphyrinogen decarboxylase family protein [Verrucomicrobiae bacterium]|nr:uroporphyrinogen decarboxylase family protein [Verrucomicrobiae bacterium]
MQPPFPINSLASLLRADPHRENLARRRQTALWQHQKPDAWPIVFNAPLTTDQENIPVPNFHDAFYNQELMLCSQFRAACAIVNARADGVPSIRVNFGTGVCLSCLGLEQEIFPDKMPWLRQHLTRDQIARLTPDDIKNQGTFSRGLEFMRCFRQIMGDSLPIYCMDTQGPFDLAHLIMGDDLFYELHEDPAFVHHLMEIALALGIKTHTWMKEIIGEPLAAHHHTGILYAENMGIRICEDTTTLLSPKDIREFAIPCTQRLAQHFGGAWVHYCGRNDHLTRAICELPEIRAINFGHIPGHEHDHPFEQDMALIHESGKVYFGRWPRRPDESGRDYLRRLHSWAAKGSLFPSGNEAVGPHDFPDVFTARDFWYSL